MRPLRSWINSFELYVRARSALSGTMSQIGLLLIWLVICQIVLLLWVLNRLRPCRQIRRLEFDLGVIMVFWQPQRWLAWILVCRIFCCTQNLVLSRVS